MFHLDPPCCRLCLWFLTHSRCEEGIIPLLAPAFHVLRMLSLSFLFSKLHNPIISLYSVGHIFPDLLIILPVSSAVSSVIWSPSRLKFSAPNWTQYQAGASLGWDVNFGIPPLLEYCSIAVAHPISTHVETTTSLLQEKNTSLDRSI